MDTSDGSSESRADRAANGAPGAITRAQTTIPFHAGARAPPIGAGARLGAYTVVRLIGYGGMGDVYEAQQDHPRRPVALKVIRPALASPEMLRRFEHEAEMLGRLKHPGIAQVYEADTLRLQDGSAQPFFAMELVEGAPLTRYGAAKNLGTRERLGLMVKVCEAVEHAHQKGVIHRDLKPANILVDASGQPKVLDFGVARLTDSDVQTTSLHTGIGQLIGTVPYMSPEQAAGDPAELDTRSDVYALGVICFELLTGQLPYKLTDLMVHEAVRIIREDEPARLSSVNKVFRGDVETIVAKALEKDKSRRYQSAGAFGADITRYLKDEPIVARPASTWYQARKFARRNKALVIGVGATVLALVLGLVGISWQAAATKLALDQTRADDTRIRRLLVESSVSEARLARQHGGWREVMSSIDRALDLGADDPASLLLLRLEAVASIDPSSFPAALSRLRAQTGMEKYEGAVLLWEAEPRFVTGPSYTPTLEVVRRAVAAGLTDADRSYARALLATTYDEAVAALLQSLGADPFHVRSRQMLLTALLLAWDMPAAEREARAWLILERGSATARLALAIARASSGARDEALEIADGLRASFTDSKVQKIATTLRAMADSSDVNSLLSRTPGEGLQVLLQQWTGMTALLGTAADQKIAPGEAGSPVLFSAPPLLQATSELMGRALVSSMFGNTSAGADQLGELYRLLPNPLAVVAYTSLLNRSERHADEARVLTEALVRFRGTVFEPFLTFQAVYANTYNFQLLEDGPQRESARESAAALGHRFMRFGPMEPNVACMVAWAGAILDRPALMTGAIQDWKTLPPRDAAWARKTAAYFYNDEHSRAAALFVAANALRAAPDDAGLQEIQHKCLVWVRKHAGPAERRVLIAAGFDVPEAAPIKPP